MRYLLLIYEDESGWTALSPEEQAAGMQEYNAFTEWLREQGLMRGGDALTPTSSATLVRVRDGETLATDGPYAETKEQLGGFYLIECDDLDRAIDAASRIPGARRGAIEIRPIVEYPD
jgi:hypothetical protein